METEYDPSKWHLNSSVMLVGDTVPKRGWYIIDKGDSGISTKNRDRDGDTVCCPTPHKWHLKKSGDGDTVWPHLLPSVNSI